MGNTKINDSSTLCKGVFLGIGKAQINEKGILYKKRFFSWDEIDEVEILSGWNSGFFKTIVITRGHRYSYGHKLFVSMRNDPDVILLRFAIKKRLRKIKDYWHKNIIVGRNFRNTQD